MDFDRVIGYMGAVAEITGRDNTSPARRVWSMSGTLSERAERVFHKWLSEKYPKMGWELSKKEPPVLLEDGSFKFTYFSTWYSGERKVLRVKQKENGNLVIDEEV